MTRRGKKVLGPKWFGGVGVWVCGCVGGCGEVKGFLAAPFSIWCKVGYPHEGRDKQTRGGLA